eukprot:TRINITY_DN3982_c0_g1_i2.p1 TRINITY_DN3982_c0_g1~~TRINITY_DN3982_c0_g1_i2.p1  ORF type:complete len:262 (+),score=59.63 TRINITY_DN3982_c0_g1_i2:245-1030(+)
MALSTSNWRSITPEQVLKLTKPTAGFLCPLSANTYGIEYLDFSILDYSSKNVIFNVGRDNPPSIDLSGVDLADIDENLYRSIKYEFSEDVLRLPSIQTTLVFCVGEREVPGFRMVERHYFRDQLVKSFDFTFGFCIPSSTNTWDAVYSVPPMDEGLINDMINNPHETKSDSFYFVDGQLVMHNKASYKYVREDAAQAKKSYEERYGSKRTGAAGGAKAASKFADEEDSEDDGLCKRVALSKVSLKQLRHTRFIIRSGFHIP